MIFWNRKRQQFFSALEEVLERETLGKETRAEMIPPAQEAGRTVQGWGDGVKTAKEVWDRDTRHKTEAAGGGGRFLCFTVGRRFLCFTVD
ncbi:unnamed protein product [Rangifer tarandus platyrhynchus]|uniref:Uncharacterized protein n=1 Tax=Rangifer tarandus platyrhynchus TaxID=3082113 RepID=A0AC59ZF45_RANTA